MSESPNSAALEPHARPWVLLALTLSAPILLNYAGWWFGAGESVGPAALIALALAFGAGLGAAALRARWMVPAFLFCLALMVASVGSPTFDWDARSIWLFHAKRIHLDGSLFAQLDDYAPWSHNDYPVIVPALSASLATLVGGWNELHPKLGGTLALAAPVILLSAVFRSSIAIQLFLAATLLVCGRLLINGFMDAILAMYGLAALVLAALAFRRGDAEGTAGSTVSAVLPATAFSAVCSVLVLLKNEGAVLFGLIVASFVAASLLTRQGFAPLRLLVACLLPVLLVGSWRLACARAGVTNDLAGTDLVGQFAARAADLGNWSLIARQLTWHTVAPVTLFVLLLVLRFPQAGMRRGLAVSGLLLTLGYTAFLCFAYLGTPHDLGWHLDTSLRRTTLPLGILALGLAVVLLAPGSRDATRRPTEQTA